MTAAIARELVFAAIDEVNASFEKLDLAKMPETRLVSEDGGIDSLAVVSLVVALENHIAARTGKSVVLVDEDFFDGEAQPLRTVGSLIDYTESLLRR